MHKWLAIALVALVATTVTTAAKPEKPSGEAGSPPKGTGPMPAARLLPQQWVTELGLSAEQSAKLEKLTAEFNKARAEHMATRRAELDALRKQMREAQAAKDTEQVRRLRIRLADELKPISELRRSYIERFRATLTAEQQQKLDRFLKEQRERARERRAGAAGKTQLDKTNP